MNKDCNDKSNGNLLCHKVQNTVYPNQESVAYCVEADVFPLTWNEILGNYTRYLLVNCLINL